MTHDDTEATTGFRVLSPETEPRLAVSDATECFVCHDWEVVVSIERGGSPVRRVATAGLVGLCAPCLRLVHDERVVELAIRKTTVQRWDFRQSDLVCLLLDICREVSAVVPAPDRPDPRFAGRLPLDHGFDDGPELDDDRP